MDATFIVDLASRSFDSEEITLTRDELHMAFCGVCTIGNVTEREKVLRSLKQFIGPCIPEGDPRIVEVESFMYMSQVVCLVVSPHLGP